MKRSFQVFYASRDPTAMLSLWNLRGRSSDRRVDEARTSPKLARATLQSARHTDRETGRARDAGKSFAIEIWTHTVVDFDHGINKAIAKIREALGNSATHPRFVETVARRGYRFLAKVVPIDAAAVEYAPTIRSLAVLPLEDLSGDVSQDYFADGMTDELIMSLGQISALRVISRTSVMSYKSVRKPLPEIARELGVEAIVEGTVLRSGARVRNRRAIDRGAD